MHIHPSKGFHISPNNSIKKFCQQNIKIEDKITEALDNLINKTENEVPEYGRLFRPVEEEFPNPDLTSIANKVKFTVKASTEKENQKGRILKMEIFSQKGNSISPIFEVGTKEEILKMLKNESFPEKIKKIIAEANHILLKKNRD